MKTCVVIPARMASQRLPRKVIRMIHGKPLLQYAYENASLGKRVERVFIATDHQKIKEISESFGASVLMTSETCQTGTDRIVETLPDLEAYDIVVNLQADEPLITAELIDLVVETLEKNPDDVVATLASDTLNEDDYLNPNKVKVIQNKQGKAIYFSRAPIPYYRDSKEVPQNSYLHIGLYAYRIPFLKKFYLLGESLLEGYEKLEQLRFLENGYSIAMSITELRPVGVDIEEDIFIIEEKIKKEKF